MTLIDKICAARGARTAAFDEDGSALSYAELRRRAERLAHEIGSSPAFVLLEGSSSVAWLVAYVACLLGRHPVLIVPPGEAVAGSRLITAFQPEVIMTEAGQFRPCRTNAGSPAEARAPLHPDLAVMLSTSGSTGSAKCVRLSLGNISANAEAIDEYLALSPDDCGIVSLPTHYSYGLSVVNSHLWAGASLVLTSRSVIEQQFWDLCRRYGVTGIAGVPYSYEMLRRIDLERQAPASLRYLTQAGGRLPVDLVRHFAKIARRRRWHFYVMYGQTEATARMAYLPPDLVEAFPESIGIAIPGGRFEIVDGHGHPVKQPNVDGELVYSGANVMMGYATGPADLALGAGPDRLATGDLARWTDQGLLKITGRSSRFIKLLGKRIGLDDVERLVEEAGLPAKATGIDEQLVLLTRDPSAPAALAKLACDRLQVPPDRVTVRHIETFPLLPSGKVDYAALKSLVSSPDFAAAGTLADPGTAGGAAVRAIFSDLFGPAIDEETASFSSLGGDSFNYISTALALESVIPNLPQDWADWPVSHLCELAGSTADLPTTKSVALPRNLDSIRAFACVLVVAMHVVGFSSEYGLRLPEDSLWHRLMSVLGMARMPLFTAMAGFLYSVMPARRGRFLPFMKRKIDLLLWPMVFGTIFYWALRGGKSGQWESLPHAFLFGYLHFWYIDAILAMFAVVSLLDSTVRMTTRRWILFTALIVAVCLFAPVPAYLIRSFGFFLFPYFLLGILLHRLPVLWSGTKPKIFASLLIAVCLAALELAPVRPEVLMEYWVRLSCGSAAVLFFVSTFPRVRMLEGIASYTFTIYLWHPAANAIVREGLKRSGQDSLLVLFVFGLVAGVALPIVMHKLIARQPNWLRTPLIGR